jgi:Cd2+/Zn2+-exporting ATPase
MGRARCSFQVRGLDCPVEVAALRSALDGAPGVGTLGFDLIHGVLTVEYDPEATNPPALIRRIAARAGMTAELAGTAETLSQPQRWWTRHARWLAVAASGLMLLTGVLTSELSILSSYSKTFYVIACLAGGYELAPGAWRSLRGRRLDIHVLMALAILGAIALGQWDEAATVAFLFGRCSRSRPRRPSGSSAMERRRPSPRPKSNKGNGFGFVRAARSRSTAGS